MTQPSSQVGYKRPPPHTRFQKGRSGNPGGRPSPKTGLKRNFNAALGEALDSDLKAIRQAKPTKAVESLARKLVLDAVDGRPGAQQLVLSLLDREVLDREVPDASALAEELAQELAEEEEDRRILGDRYDEYKARLEAAVAAGSLDDVRALAQEFQVA